MALSLACFACVLINVSEVPAISLARLFPVITYDKSKMDSKALGISG